MLKYWLYPIISKIALYYCREILQAEHQTAIVHKNTLKMGVIGLMPIETASDKVISSLEIQITALEALMGIPSEV